MSDSHPLPRKVLMTADTVGGVWTYAIELARGLDDRGPEVRVQELQVHVDLRRGPLDEAIGELVEKAQQRMANQSGGAGS